MAKSTEARCLVDHDGHKANEVLTGALAERAIAEGWGDADADAVKYAKSLPQPEAAEEEVHEADESDGA